MQVKITQSPSLSHHQIVPLLELIKTGGQIPDINQAKAGLQRADQIAIIDEDNLPVSLGVIKNPLDSYRQRIFKEAGVIELAGSFQKELGYLCTRPQYEGKKFCQNLVASLLHDYTSQLFATTRNDAIIHILKKFGFKIVGITYQKDLKLLVRL